MGSCDYYIIDPHNEHVGFIDIKDAPKDKNFKACFEENIFPYYYSRSPASFSYGKDSLKKYFHKKYNNFEDVSCSGYVTARFVINCEGEAGRFIVHQVGPDYVQKKLNPKIVNNLLEAVQALEDWKPIQFFDDKYDSFFHLSFKIEGGDLVEILP